MATYDLYFPEQKLGLMLVRDKEGRALSGQFGPSESGTELASKIDIPVEWDTWHGGGGHSQAVDAVPGGIDWAENAVVRFPGFVMPAGKKTQVSVNLGKGISAFTIVDPGTGYVTAPTIGFTGGGGTGAAAVATVNAGEITAITVTESGYGYTSAPTVTITGGSGSDGDATVTIADLVLGSVSDSFEQGGSLFFLMGRYCIKINNGTDAGPIVTYEKDFGPGVTAYDAEYFIGNVYVGTSDVLWGRDIGGNWSNIDPDTSIKTTVRVDKLTTVYWEANDPLTANSFVGRDRLVGRVSTNSKQIVHMSAPNDPLRDAAWTTGGGEITINKGTYPINSLVASNQHVWIGTSGGLADLNAVGYSPVLNPYFGAMRDDTRNGSAALYWNGIVFINHVQGLAAVPVGDASRHDTDGFVEYGHGYSNESPIYGQCSALGIEGSWPIASFYNGTDSWICYGELASQSSRTPIIWHPEHVLRGFQVTHLKATSPATGQPRLWFGGTSGTLWWASLPRAATPLQEYLQNLSGAGVYTGTHAWETRWLVVMSAVDLGDKASRKIALRYDAQADYLGTARYLRVFARAEHGPWVQQGSGADPVLATSPRSSLLPTNPLVTGHNIQIRIDGAGGATTPAVLRQFKARFEQVQETRETVAYIAVLASALSTGNTAVSQRDVLADFRALKALQTSAPVQFRDEDDESKLVRVNPGISRRELKHYPLGGNSFESVKAVVFSVSQVPSSVSDLILDTSGTTTTNQTNVLVWDSGSSYDSEKTWG